MQFPCRIFLQGKLTPISVFPLHMLNVKSRGSTMSKDIGFELALNIGNLEKGRGEDIMMMDRKK